MLNDEELRIEDLVRKGLIKPLDRKFFMRGVLDSAEEALKATNKRLQESDRSELRDAIRRYNEDVKFKAFRCSRCGFRIQNATKYVVPSAVSCPQCGHPIRIPATPITSKQLAPTVVKYDVAAERGFDTSHFKFGRGRDDLVEEEYQGNAGFKTLSERAKMFHSISDDDWDALTEEEKLDYIARLPPEKPHGESNKDEDCPDCDDDEQTTDEDPTEDETSESDEDADEIIETTEDELDPDEVMAKYRRTIKDKDYPY